MRMEEIVSEDTHNQSYEYQSKIRDQAKRLCLQENYISLLEKRLKQYNPSETLPITHNSLIQDTTVCQSSFDIQTKSGNQQKYSSPKERVLAKKINNNQSTMIPQLNKLKGREPNDNIYDLYNRLITENKRLEKEKEEISSTLKSEIINNDEQRNQIELLKQTIESSLIQSGLKNKLDVIKQKYDKTSPNDDYSRIILDITSLKNNNDELLAQCNRMRNELKASELFKEKVQKSVDRSIKEMDNAKNRICSFEKENNILIKELSVLSTHNKAIDEKLDTTINEKNNLMNSCDALSFENDSLKKEYELIQKEKEECLKKIAIIETEKHIQDVALHEVKVQNEIMTNERKNNKNQTEQFYSTVKALQEKYDSLLTEFFEMKKYNQQHCKDNTFLDGECNRLRGQLYKLNDLTAMESENKRLFCTLNQLETEMAIVKNERCCVDNYYQSKLGETDNDKRGLEETLYKHTQEILRLTEENRELKKYHNGNALLVNETKLLKDNNSKALNENNFYYNFLMKVIKCLIENKHLQNMLLNLIDLNIRLMNLSFEKEKIPTVISSKEMDRIYEQILTLENEVKRYEVYSI